MASAFPKNDYQSQTRAEDGIYEDVVPDESTSLLWPPSQPDWKSVPNQDETPLADVPINRVGPTSSHGPPTDCGSTQYLPGSLRLANGQVGYKAVMGDYGPTVGKNPPILFQSTDGPLKIPCFSGGEEGGGGNRPNNIPLISLLNQSGNNTPVKTVTLEEVIGPSIVGSSTKRDSLASEVAQPLVAGQHTRTHSLKGRPDDRQRRKKISSECRISMEEQDGSNPVPLFQDPITDPQGHHLLEDLNNPKAGLAALPLAPHYPANGQQTTSFSEPQGGSGPQNISLPYNQDSSAFPPDSNLVDNANKVHFSSEKDDISLYGTPKEEMAPPTASGSSSRAISVSSDTKPGWVRNQLQNIFQPTDNKLAMKLFGSKKALIQERVRQKAAGHWIIHPCSSFRHFMPSVNPHLLNKY
eukprot:snap_masked-scaffold384_size188899-processed-gene-0.13 protein:Tk06455 transcript:snap_masked-scaffold384_size188899-processed-gene-0.13-mRNA-1 annotation:"cyclic nucleotide and voltage-activated ion channel"